LDLEQENSSEWKNDLFPPSSIPSLTAGLNQWDNVYGTEGMQLNLSSNVNSGGLNSAFGSSFGGFPSLSASLALSGPPPPHMRSPPGLIPSVGAGVRDSPSAPPGLSNKSNSDKPSTPVAPPRRTDFLSYLNSTNDWKT
jgi:hypothetical protein